MLERLIAAAVSGGGVPGAVAMAGRGPSVLETVSAGYPADTVFDLASLTKVVATTTVTLALGIDLSSYADSYVPAPLWSGVTVRHLLTHTSGLPDSRKFYQWCADRSELLASLYATELAAPPGTRVTYSDLGFITLGEIVAVVAGEPLDAAVRRLVLEPLGMTSAGFLPAFPASRFAPTTEPDTGLPPPGVVHDENARLLGGVAGHAGLFATAADLARFAQWWICAGGSGDGGPVPVSVRRLAMTCQTDGLPGVEGFPGRRGLGWVCTGDRYDILGDAWPATSVSHTGFTGTSLALDPKSGLWVVLLTNGVHYGRDATAVKALRRAVHAAVAAEYLGLRGLRHLSPLTGPCSSVAGCRNGGVEGRGWRRAAGPRARYVTAGVAAVVLAAGAVTGVLLTGGGAAVPPLYMAGIAEQPCTGQVSALPATETTGHFLTGSSVLSTEAASTCTAGTVAASRRWLDQGQVPGDSAAEREIATRALLDLRLSVLPDGAVVAGYHTGWDYTWPRDSSWVVAALAGTGHAAQALSILEFLQKMQEPDGTWAARYYTDGSGPVQDGRPAELDAVGWVPWAVWSWAEGQQLAAGSPARAELVRLWPMVTKAADAAIASLTSDGLPEAAMDYWEDKPIGVTLGTAAPLLAGLRAAADLAGDLGESAEQTRWAEAAGGLSAAISRTFGETGYQRTPSAGSGADAAVTFLGPPFGTPDAAVRTAANAAQTALQEPNGGLRPGTAWHGAAGVAWTPETAMFALFDAGTGQEAAANRLIGWLTEHRTSLGEFPEQVAPDGKPASVAPLAWTDAIVLLTLLAQSGHLPAVPAPASP
jgi:glucoamylase